MLLSVLTFLFAPFLFFILNFPALAASRSDIGGKAKLENVVAVASPTRDAKFSEADAILALMVLSSPNSDGVCVVGGAIGICG